MLMLETLYFFLSYAVEQARRDAVAFGLACNGILRADACVYQELFLGGATDDCLV